MNSKKIISHLKEKEKLFDQEGFLHFKEKIRYRKLNVVQFINNLITKWYPKYCTYTAIDNLDTGCAKHHSVESIYKTVKYYYPNITLIEVIGILYYYGYQKDFYALPCNTINKITFFKAGSRGYGNSFFSDWTLSSCRKLEVKLEVLRKNHFTKEKCEEYFNLLNN